MLVKYDHFGKIIIAPEWCQFGTDAVPNLNTIFSFKITVGGFTMLKL